MGFDRTGVRLERLERLEDLASLARIFRGQLRFRRLKLPALSFKYYASDAVFWVSSTCL